MWGTRMAGSATSFSLMLLLAASAARSSSPSAKEPKEIRAVGRHPSSLCSSVGKYHWVAGNFKKEPLLLKRCIRPCMLFITMRNPSTRLPQAHTNTEYSFLQLESFFWVHCVQKLPIFWHRARGSSCNQQCSAVIFLLFFFFNHPRSFVKGLLGFSPPSDMQGIIQDYLQRLGAEKFGYI